MELVEADFSGGVVGAFAYVDAECKRYVRAREEYLAVTALPGASAERVAELAAEAKLRAPLWQRISGLDLKDMQYVPPGSARAGIRRLLRVVEKMYRAEMKTDDIDDDGGPERLSDGSISYAGRSAFWDPIPEICKVLGIAERTLSSFCKMRTGLTLREMCDAIRCEHLRACLREKFRGLMQSWRESMDPDDVAEMSDDFEGSGYRFLKWMRGGGRGETRKGLACSLGLTSRERLDRAAFVLEGETLEKIELDVAMGVIREVFGTMADGPTKGVDPKRDEAGSHGACSDDVSNPWAKGDYEGRFAGEECPPEADEGGTK